MSIATVKIRRKAAPIEAAAAKRRGRPPKAASEKPKAVANPTVIVKQGKRGQKEYVNNVQLIRLEEFQRQSTPRLIGGKKVRMSLGQYAKAIVGGDILVHEKNRMIVRDHVRNIARNFNANALESPPAVEMADGKIRLLDTHHQASAILSLYEHGLLTPEESKHIIELEVFPRGANAEDIMRLRHDRNNKRSWSSFDKLVGTDTDFSRTFLRVIKHHEDQGRRIGKNFATQMAAFLSAWAGYSGRTSPSYVNLYTQNRKTYKSYTDLVQVKKQFAISEKKIVDFLAATDFAFGVLEALGEKTNKESKRLSRQAMLFGFFVYLALWREAAETKHVTYWAKKLDTFNTDVRNQLNSLVLNRDHAAEHRLYKLLGVKGV